MTIDLLTQKSLSMVKFVDTCLKSLIQECGMTLNVMILSLENLSKLQLQNSHIFILLKLRFMVLSNKLLHWVTIKSNKESADFKVVAKWERVFI